MGTQHRDKHLLTHAHTDNSCLHVCRAVPRLQVSLPLSTLFDTSHPPSLLQQTSPFKLWPLFPLQASGVIRGLVVLVLGEEPGPSGSHHGAGLKAPSTALIRIACSLSNCNKKQLSWKPALDVVQISECLPSPHLGYFPSFLVFPLRLLLLVWQEYVGPQLSEDCGSQPVSTMRLPF